MIEVSREFFIFWEKKFGILGKKIFYNIVVKCGYY